MADWSSLPSDMINHVAAIFLDTNDLDYYMDFRAVCHSWRSATADPKISPEEPRFRPSRWVMIDEVKGSFENLLGSDDDTRLFVNATTGRFLRKSLPLLHRYYFVTTTSGGFVILADRKSPHAARVLNPFTGSLTSFMAPVPHEMNFAAAVVGSADSFTLVMASDSACKVYWADPGSEAFLFDMCNNRPSGLLPYIAGKYAGRKNGSLVTDTDNVDQVRSREIGYRILAADAGGGEIIVVCLEEGSHHIEVLKKKMDSAEASMFEKVTSIGNRAFFAGDRCLLIEADKLPSIEANCIYYQIYNPDGGLFGDIFVYDLNHGKAEMIAASISTNTISQLMNVHPLTIVQHLVSYTMNLPDYELMWEFINAVEFPADFEFDYDELFDYDEFEFGD